MLLSDFDSFGLSEGDADAEREEFELFDTRGDAEVDIVVDDVGEDENDILGVGVNEIFVTAGDSVSVTSDDCVFEMSGERDADPEELEDFVCACEFDEEDDSVGDADEEGEPDGERETRGVTVSITERVTIGDCVYTTLSETDADIDLDRIGVEEIRGDEDGSALAILDIEADDDVVSVDELVLVRVRAGDCDIDIDAETVSVVKAGVSEGLRDIDELPVDVRDTRGL